ncbi:hypothetical protein L6452_34772 [Arctium lappa]|uniref:Uncharacterized protein n=1 Tax=Arctium lappa TaxID=4217 RepID=A0ACB8YKN7_ARCLA|nr:hypothetical protein L6452_34772 [Arctium lappa]
MGKMEIEVETDSDEEDNEEVCDLTQSDFINQMHAMMTKLQELELKLKRETGVITNKNQSIQKLSEDIAEKKVLIEVLHKNIVTNAKEKTIILKEIAKTNSKLGRSEFDFKELTRMYSSRSEEKKSLLTNLKALEGKLYSVGQTEQTIHLNKPKESKESWGLGYENPHYLKNGIFEVPALYDFTFLRLSQRYHDLKVFCTGLSKEDETKETEKRKNTSKL